MTYRELKNEGIKISDDAVLLLRELKGWSLSEYLLNSETEAAEAFISVYREGLKRLRAHEPLQYITGKAPFYGRDMLVGPGVLIPRFDTEILVGEVLKDPERDTASVLDLCTGSGCIAVTLALEGMKGRVTAADISPEALSYAKRNAALYGVGNITFVESDMFENLPGTYDIIVSNPPYIPLMDKETLDPEVRDHEPASALFGGDDGLFFYRIIAREGKGHLNEGGRMYLEIGSSEKDSVKALLEEEGYQDIQTFTDLAGKERVITCLRD